MSTSGTIPHEDVLHSIYEFLSFHGYKDSLAALQSESGVAYNVIHASSLSASGSDAWGNRRTTPRGTGAPYPPPSRDALEAAVMDGNWSEVLHAYVDGLLLPEETRATLYEAIFEELLEVHGLQPAAKAMFYNAPAFSVMRQHAPARYARLERSLLGFDAIAWEEQKKRNAQARSTDTLARRGEVLKQLLNAIRFSSDPYLGKLPAALFLASRVNPTDESVRESDRTGDMEQPAAKRVRADVGIQESARVVSSAATAATFLGYPLTAPRTVGRLFDCSEDNKSISCSLVLPAAKRTDEGASVVLLGRADGGVDFLDVRTGALVGQPLNHTGGVLSMSLDESVAMEGGNTWVAVGYRDGWVKVYNTDTHRLVRRFNQPHSMGVTCAVFGGHQDPDELGGHHQLIFTGSYDSTIKLLCLATGSVVATVQDAHQGTFINALCPLPCELTEGRSFTGAAMSAGNDGTLAFWKLDPNTELLSLQKAQATAESNESSSRLSSASVKQLGSNLKIRALHVECRDAIGSALVPIPKGVKSENEPADDDGVTTASQVQCEVLVLTRSAVALILSVTLNLGVENSVAATEQPIRPVLLCLLRGSKPLRHIACAPCASPGLQTSSRQATTISSSGAVPMLSVYVTTEEGTIVLYNVEMNWRDEQRWETFGGAMVVTTPTDESSVIITEVGHPVKDVRVCPLPLRAHEAPAVLASAESLPTFYLLE